MFINKESSAFQAALLCFHVSPKGGIDAALVASPLDFEEIHPVGIKPDRDLFLLARPKCCFRKEAIIELVRIGKVDIPVLHDLNLCPVSS